MICGLGSGWLTCAPDSQGGLHQGGTSGREICRACGHHVLPAGVADGHQGVVHRIVCSSSMALFFQDSFFMSRPSLPCQAGCLHPTILTQHFHPSLGLQTARHPAAVRQAVEKSPVLHSHRSGTDTGTGKNSGVGTLVFPILSLVLR